MEWFFRADLERFDEPSYGSGGVEFESEGIAGQLTSVVGPVKKFLPHIIAVVVIAAIAWFAYDYFFGSVVSVTITVKDTEGKLLDDSMIKIFAAGSSEPLFDGTGSSTYAVSLKAGTYRYEANAPGYAIKKSSFDVSSEETGPIIKLQQDIDVEIVNFEQDFPESLFVGGSKQFSVQLKNHSGSSESIELVAESDLEGYELVGTTQITIPANSTQAVSVEIIVPASTVVKDQKNGDEKTAVLRVKYTEEQGKTDFVLYPNPGLEISLSDADFGAKARENYNKDEEEISIKNSNYFPIEDLELSVEITSSTNNDPTSVLTWFQFTEIANQEKPWRIEISSIPAKGSIKKELQVVLPMTAKKELGIKGNIVLDAPFLSEPIKETLTLDVKESAEFGIELSLSPRSPIEIEWGSTLGKYEDKIITINVKNSGKLDLENLVFSVANSTVCSTGWLEFIENSIDSLRTGETEGLKLNASAPIAMRGQEQSKYCDIRHRFDNPAVAGTYAEGVEKSFIEIVPETD